MSHRRLAHSRRMPLPELRAALDVGEEKGVPVGRSVMSGFLTLRRVMGL